MKNLAKIIANENHLEGKDKDDFNRLVRYFELHAEITDIRDEVSPTALASFELLSTDLLES